MKILAMDPGGTSGYAIFKGSDKPVEVGEVPQNNLLAWLSGNKDIDVWVVEDYYVRKQKGDRGFDHTWNRGDTLRIIGAVEYHAFLTASEFHLQQPSQKVMGYKLMGKEYVKGKSGMHIFDAIAHGQVFLGKNPRYING